MIIAYAQAADLQGLVAAVDGELVFPGATNFIDLREKAVSLNLSTTPHRADGVEIRFGRGIVRLEIVVADDEKAIDSPIVVVADAAELLESRDRAVRRAVESVIAIGRDVDVKTIEVGFATGERLHLSARKKRRVATATATAVAVALMAMSIVLLARSCGGSGDLFGAAGSWTR